MIKAIIFDCFGVLIGTGYWNVYKRVGGERHADKPFIDELLDRANLNLLDNKKLHIETAKKLGIPILEWEEAIMKDELPNPELFNYIHSNLSGSYKLAILSNASTGTLKRIIPEDLLSLFDITITSGDVGLVKPDPQIYNLAASKLGVLPNEALFIDDHKDYIKGAEEVGMKTVQFKDSLQVINDVNSFLGK